MTRDLPVPAPSPAPVPAPVPAAFDRRMIEALVCPRTEGPLRYDPEAQELISESARLAFPIRDGIPIMLASAARVLD